MGSSEEHNSVSNAQDTGVTAVDDTAGETASDDPYGLYKKPKFWDSKRNRFLTFAAGFLLIVLAVALFYLRGPFGDASTPSITLMSPQPVSAASRDEIVIDVVLSELPEGNYPAASLSVEFDSSKLEFVGLKQGTMMTLGNVSANGEMHYDIPLWVADIAASNQRGVVNIMYLDISGGSHAYVADGFAKGQSDIVVRLVFRLRDSAIAGNQLNITVADACFATIGGAEDGSSLATSMKTLRAYPAMIIVKD
ncbi:MAG: hypothetical protein LBG68_04110 [Coriobacteriales bacterium]|jgi:hypothetical protein|nr:hypothetical protein [Coriobacteriales bacterium]